jgi:hypothetical protein
MARDFYAKAPLQSITSPDIVAAGYSNAAKDEITLQFNQEVVWDDSLTRGKNTDYELVLDKLGQQYLKDWITFEDTTTKVASLSGAGALVKLKLTKPSAAKKVSYVANTSYPRVNNTTYRFAGPLIWNKPGTLPALTFLEFPVAAQFAPVTAWQDRAIAKPGRVRIRTSSAGLELRFPAGSKGYVSMQLRDASGRLLRTWRGQASGTMILPALAAGAYFLTVQGEQIRQQETVVIPEK